MTDFKLIALSKEFEKKAFEFLQEFLMSNSEINGVGGLKRYEDYKEVV